MPLFSKQPDDQPPRPRAKAVPRRAVGDASGELLVCTLEWPGNNGSERVTVVEVLAGSGGMVRVMRTAEFSEEVDDQGRGDVIVVHSSRLVWSAPESFDTSKENRKR